MRRSNAIVSADDVYEYDKCRHAATRMIQDYAGDGDDLGMKLVVLILVGVWSWLVLVLAGVWSW